MKTDKELMEIWDRYNSDRNDYDAEKEYLKLPSEEKSRIFDIVNLRTHEQ